ncbi:MAG: WYL domain-containing protein [Thermodesulfobacteriota bacterium]
MQARRMSRLMRLMIEFAGREFRSAEDLYISLGVSRSQLYRDKADLEKMGFAFTFHRDRRAFTVEEDPGVKVEGLTLSEILALIMAVGRLPETGDFTLAYRALTGLKKITVDQPGPVSSFVLAAIQDVVARESYGCRLETLESLVEAVSEKRRLHLVYGRPGAARPRRFSVDPKRLVFRASRLYLETDEVGGKRRLFRTAYLREVIPTPFLSPD